MALGVARIFADRGAVRVLIFHRQGDALRRGFLLQETLHPRLRHIGINVLEAAFQRRMHIAIDDLECALGVGTGSFFNDDHDVSPIVYL